MHACQSLSLFLFFSLSRQVNDFHRRSPVEWLTVLYVVPNTSLSGIKALDLFAWMDVPRSIVQIVQTFHSSSPLENVRAKSVFTIPSPLLETSERGPIILLLGETTNRRLVVADESRTEVERTAGPVSEFRHRGERNEIPWSWLEYLCQRLLRSAAK